MVGFVRCNTEGGRLELARVSLTLWASAKNLPIPAKVSSTVCKSVSGEVPQVLLPPPTYLLELLYCTPLAARGDDLARTQEGNLSASGGRHRRKATMEPSPKQIRWVCWVGFVPVSDPRPESPRKVLSTPHALLLMVPMASKLRAIDSSS